MSGIASNAIVNVNVETNETNLIWNPFRPRFMCGITFLPCLAIRSRVAGANELHLAAVQWLRPRGSAYSEARCRSAKSRWEAVFLDPPRSPSGQCATGAGNARAG